MSLNVIVFKRIFLVNNVAHRDVHKWTRHIPTCLNPSLSLSWMSPPHSHDSTHKQKQEHHRTKKQQQQINAFTGIADLVANEERHKKSSEERQQKQQMGQDATLWRQRGRDGAKEEADDFYHGGAHERRKTDTNTNQARRMAAEREDTSNVSERNGWKNMAPL